MSDCLGSDFDHSCIELAQRVRQRFAPDLWLGVETGGGYILRRMSALGRIDSPSAFVSAARPHTGQKRKWLPAILSKLPRVASDMLRIGEHLVREWRFERTRRASPRNVSFGRADETKIATARVVALIDDAIDSGSSIVQIVDAIHHINPSCSVVVAVIVQTFGHPLRCADVSLRQHELVRFPWSADAGN